MLQGQHKKGKKKNQSIKMIYFLRNSLISYTGLGKLVILERKKKS
jgi:hypothetical protein